MKNWKLLKNTCCLRCNTPVLAAPDFTGFDIVIDGNEPMVFKHPEKTDSCESPLIGTNWGKYTEWRQAE